MAKDDLYQRPRSPVPPFEFDDQAARVFDDMISRSILFYGEIIDRQVQLIDRYCQQGTTVYDLGCSSGNLGPAVCRRMGERPFTMKAVEKILIPENLDQHMERLQDAGSATVDIWQKWFCFTSLIAIK